jgi:hypothetical protein
MGQQFSSAAEIPDGTRIDVYRNLNEDCLSIRSREPENRGIVIAHSECICVDEPCFVIQRGSQETAREEGKRNVHAFVRGVATSEEVKDVRTTRVTYNPFIYDWFVTQETEIPVKRSEIAKVTTDGVEVPTKGLIPRHEALNTYGPFIPAES